MRNYRIKLMVDDFDNPNGVNHYSEHEKEVSEEIFNSIYKMIL